MKTLLYFEECETNLSHELFKRNDIDPIIIRTNKNMKYFTPEYLRKTAGIKNYLIDYYGDMPTEAKKFQAWLDDQGIKIDYFLNDSEYYLEFVNKFARHLGLDALTDEQIAWVRDKVAMKQRFREIGLNTVDFAPIESKSDLVRFFVNHGEKKIVFKPRRGMNSIGTYVIESIGDIEALDVEFKPGKYMAEDFCYDHEWSIESLVQDGKVLDSYVTYLPNPTIWATIACGLNCHITVPKTPEFFKFVPKDFIQQIVTGMGLKDGAMTIEVFVNNDGTVKASELGWRLPGGQATLNHSFSYGININNLLLDIATHKPVTLKYRDEIISVGTLMLPNKDGVVESVTPLETLLGMEGVIGGQLYAKVGQYQEKRRVGSDASGWLQVAGRNETETLQRIQNVFDNYDIQVAKGVEDKSYVKKI